MEKAFIVGGLRSYIGIENSMYRHVPAEILGARVLKKVITRYVPEKIDLVIAGNGVGAGGNLTRLMMLEAGLDESIPGMTIDVQCGSGLESIAIAAAKIQSGQADVIIAGGFESSSTAPRRGYCANHPDYEKFGGKDSWYRVAKFMPDSHCESVMLEGAEQTARTENITRKELDCWALQSHQKAKKAREDKVLEDIVVEVEDQATQDEGIRDRMNERLLARLPYVVKDGQRITAGNACLTNDGAAFVVLCSEKYAKAKGIKAQAEFVGVAEVGANPLESPRTAILAIEKLLQKNKLEISEIDVVECNEAFAVIDALFARKYPEKVEDYNIFGGALAYGHPYGASGGIIALHLLKALEDRKGRYGICSIAAAGGIGTAILLKYGSI